MFMDRPQAEGSGVQGTEAVVRQRQNNGGGGATPPRRGVLIVDDNEAMVRGLETTLRQAGYASRAFHSGRAALDHLESSLQTQDRPGAAVLDVHLPDISGLIVARHLREALGPALPIIMLSGDGSMEVLNSLHHVGATRFFHKPFRAAELVAELGDLVR